MAWQKTACVLCGNGCGLEVQVEGNRIVKVRSDQGSPISEGYVCRKGAHVAYHQHDADRLLYPLKRVRDGFERVSWDQALERDRHPAPGHPRRARPALPGLAERRGRVQLPQRPVPRPPDAKARVPVQLLGGQPGVLRPVLGARPDPREPGPPLRRRPREHGHAGAPREEPDDEPPSAPGPPPAAADVPRPREAPGGGGPAAHRDGGPGRHPPGHPPRHRRPAAQGDDRSDPSRRAGTTPPTSRRTPTASPTSCRGSPTST